MCEVVYPASNGVGAASNHIWYSYVPSTRPNRFKVEYHNGTASVGLIWVSAARFEYKDRLVKFYDSNEVVVMLVVDVISVTLEEESSTIITPYIPCPSPYWPSWQPWVYTAVGANDSITVTTGGTS